MSRQALGIQLGGDPDAKEAKVVFGFVSLN
jgi:hypothetical protein